MCNLFVINLEQEKFPCIFGIFVFQMEQELAALSTFNDGISKDYFHLNAFSTWEMRIQYLLCHFPAHLWVIERDKKNSWIKLNTNCTRQINTSLSRVGTLTAQKHQPFFRTASTTLLRSWKALEVLRALHQFQIFQVLVWFWSWEALVSHR